MSLEAFMRGKGKLDGTGARLAYEDRWMVFSGVANRWVVYQRKQSTQKTKVLFAGDPDEALEILEQGLLTRSVRETRVEDPKVSVAEVSDSLNMGGLFDGVPDSGAWLPAYWFFCLPTSGIGAGR